MATIHRTPFLALALVAGLIAGCGDEEIRNYKAPKPQDTEKKMEVPKAAAAGGSSRILGLAIPDNGQHWYIKLMGPSDDIAKVEADFDKFINSISFPKGGDKPISWKVPEGWKETQGNQFSYAAFAIPAGESKLNLTVSAVGGSLKENVDRWRNQLSIPSDGAGIDIGQAIKIDGRDARRIDLKGTAGKGGMPPFMKGK